MYPPPMFTVDDPDTLKAMLKAVGLGTLITQGADGPVATHIPFVYDETAGVLRGHLSRGNPHHGIGPTRALVLFHLMDAYVTPSFYASKARHGRVAPTWNYEVLHVHGSLRWIEDPAWLLRNVEDLTNRYEAGQTQPWTLSDAPDGFIDTLIPRIVGMEIDIDRIECRRKLSQNSNGADRRGVIEGLTRSPDPGAHKVGAAMKALFEVPASPANGETDHRG